MVDTFLENTKDKEHISLSCLFPRFDLKDHNGGICSVKFKLMYSSISNHIYHVQKLCGFLKGVLHFGTLKVIFIL